ncbi:hypothetical protein BGX33_006304 [Mortierella sp. NVP41]|nr:hypothetical protein BGX33_006304 [Mortierella sp. NVP41]
MSQLVNIPKYQTACLAADEGNGVYLIGFSSPRNLEVNFVPDIFSTTVKLVSKREDKPLYSVNAGKACFTHPQPEAETSTYDKSGSYWANLRLGFKINGDAMLWRNLTNYLTPDPLLALGTYAPSTGTVSKGYTIVFDKSMEGLAYPTTGNAANVSLSEPMMTLDAPVNVNMNNIVLSADAISVTMSGTGYILDKAKDSVSTVIYSITPETSLPSRRSSTRVPLHFSCLRWPQQP